MQYRLTGGLREGESMQVSNHVGAANYTVHQRNRNTKYIEKHILDENSESGESSKTPYSAEDANYRGHYSAWLTQRMISTTLHGILRKAYFAGNQDRRKGVSGLLL